MSYQAQHFVYYVAAYVLARLLLRLFLKLEALTVKSLRAWMYCAVIFYAQPGLCDFYFFNCDTGQQSVATVDGVDVPGCVHGSNAEGWTNWSSALDFEASELDSGTLSEAFVAGFVMVGTAFAIGKGFALLINFIKG